MREKIFKIIDEEDNIITIYDDSYNSVKIVIEGCETWLCLNKKMTNDLIDALITLEKDLK